VERLAVLGGSSPFTAELIRVLEEARLGGRELVLYGRSREGIEALTRLAAYRLGGLGWQVRGADRLEEAIDGAGVVLHQIRYGGMEGRAADEALAQRFGVPADETLGPAGLQSALRTLAGLEQLAEAIRRQCPAATVLNLTNPLSLTTGVLWRRGARACIGLCELPWTTVCLACECLGLSPSQVHWRYAGLNHRGFICGLHSAGRNRLGELSDNLGERTIEGITAAEIRQLGALPLKYHRLFRAGAHGDVGRAAELTALRRQLLAELRGLPGGYPASLGLRRMPWYRESVVPALHALSGGPPLRQTFNVCGPDGVVREVQGCLGRAGLDLDTWGPGSGAVGDWLERFVAHEQAVTAVAIAPCHEGVEQALALDPTLRGQGVRGLGVAIWEQYRIAAPALLA
jgi:6-phospho-beta-glucosidase